MKEYIERNALIEELKRDLKDDCNMYNSHIEKEIRNAKYEFAIDILKDAYTVNVQEVVHGKWEICSDGYYPYCSVCTEEPRGMEMTKYCPNCGAKMDL